MIHRRDVLKAGGAFALAATPLANSPAKTAQRGIMQANDTDVFWPDGARLVISISMQMEAGLEEGLPRLLYIFARRNVKVTSHMVGAAVEKHPILAKEIVQRGHEPSGHGQTWTPQYSMTSEQERKNYVDSAATIERITGVRPVGFN